MTKQAVLDFTPPPERLLKFSGPGYVPELDKKRLSKHCTFVLNFLFCNKGIWFPYEELAGCVGIPAGSIRTRVSNLKAAGHNIEVRTRDDRFREVRLV